MQGKKNALTASALPKIKTKERRKERKERDTR